MAFTLYLQQMLTCTYFRARQCLWVLFWQAGSNNKQVLISLYLALGSILELIMVAQGHWHKLMRPPGLFSFQKGGEELEVSLKSELSACEGNQHLLINTMNNIDKYE